MRATLSRIASAGILFVLFLFTPYAQASAATYYVDTAGANTNSGTSLASAWKTIDYAESKVQPGDTVLINDGIYAQAPGVRLTITHSGTQTSPIAFNAIHPGAVTFLLSNSSYGMWIGANYRTFDGIRFDVQNLGAYAVGATAANLNGIQFTHSIFANANSGGLLCNGCTLVTDSQGQGNTYYDFYIAKSASTTSAYFARLAFSNARYGLYVQQDNVTITDFHVRYGASTTPVYLVGSSNSVVNNSDFTGSGPEAVAIDQGSGGIAASNNLIDHISVNPLGTGLYGVRVGLEGVPNNVNYNVINNLTLVAPNAVTLHAVLIGGGYKNVLQNSYIAAGAYDLVDKGSYSTIVRNNVFNDAVGNGYPAVYPKGSTGSFYYNNLISKVTNTGVAIGLAKVNGSVSPTDPATSSTGIIVQNNLMIAGSAANIYNLWDSSEQVSPDYNFYQYSSPFARVVSTAYPTLAAWKAAFPAADAHSLQGNAPVVNGSGNLSTSADFMPQQFSPVIDAGIVIAERTTDMLGNPIYGAPDIGPFEYQPPYTMGSDMPMVGVPTRVYGDGKFRPLTASSSASVPLSVTNLGGDTTQWLDLNVTLWDASVTQHRQWFETTLASSTITSTTNTVQGLSPGALYKVSVDNAASGISGSSCNAGICTADAAGVVTFTYTGPAGAHCFDLAPTYITSLPQGWTSSQASMTFNATTQLWRLIENTAATTSHQGSNYMTLPQGYTTGNLWTLSFAAAPVATSGQPMIRMYVINTDNQSLEYGAADCSLVGAATIWSWKGNGSTNLMATTSVDQNGWHVCTLQIRPSATAGGSHLRVALNLSTATTSSYTGDGVSGIQIKNISLQGTR